MKLGDRIKQERQRLKMTQPKLASLAGCGQTLISKLEREHAESTQYAAQIARALGVNTDWLLSGSGPKARNLAARADSSKHADLGNSYTTTLLETVPVIRYADIDTFSDVIAMHREGTRRLMELPVMMGCANVEESFFIRLIDRNNEPELSLGEYILIDTTKTPEPGDFVCVKTKHGYMIGRLAVNADESYTAISVDRLIKCRILDDMSNIVGVKAISLKVGSK